MNNGQYQSRQKIYNCQKDKDKEDKKSIQKVQLQRYFYQQSELEIVNRQMGKMSLNEQQFDKQYKYKQYIRPIIFQKNTYFKKQTSKKEDKKHSYSQQDQKHRQICQFKPKMEQSFQEENLFLKKCYQNDIISFLSQNHKSIIEYFPINFKKYCEIHSFWKKKTKNIIIKRTNLISVQNLTARALGGLQYNEWLNDDIVNIYIELLQRQVSKQSKIKVVNSYFATLTINKQYNRVDKFLKNRKINKNHQLIIPINENYHWYFVRLSQSNLIVFDSLSKQGKQNKYMQNSIIQNIFKFGRIFYGAQITCQICSSFPKQKNTYDCGVFMLLGIKDLLNKSKAWLFKQEEIRFKRLQIAAQILSERLFPNQFNSL